LIAGEFDVGMKILDAAVPCMTLIKEGEIIQASSICEPNLMSNLNGIDLSAKIDEAVE
jgi:hypothetical protein